MSIDTDIFPTVRRQHQLAREVAVDWQVKLFSGEAGPADVSEFETWLRARPENVEAYARLTGLWDGMEGLSKSEIVRETLNAARSRKVYNASANIFKPFGLALRGLLSLQGAAVLSVVAIAAIVTVNIFDPGPSVYRTALGEQRTIQLDDGSTVMLNTATAIKVSYIDDERRISLIDGQASFDVVKDADRPFIVNVGDGEVRALGTQFDIYKSHDGVTVTLIEGKVEITSAPSRSRDFKSPSGAAALEAIYHAELSPGEQAAIAPAGPISQIAAVDIDRVVAWREGKVNFRNTRLGEAVEEMNRYSSTKISLAEKDLAELRISGVFRVGNSKNFVNALESLFDIRVQHNTRNEILLLGASDSQQG